MKKTRFFFFGEFSSLLSDIYILCYGFIKSTVYLSVKKYPSKIIFFKIQKSYSNSASFSNLYLFSYDTTDEFTCSLYYQGVENRHMRNAIKLVRTV